MCYLEKTEWNHGTFLLEKLRWFLRHGKSSFSIQIHANSISFEVSYLRLIVSWIIFLCFVARRGIEAINIEIVERHINKVSQIGRIPKKKESIETNNQVSGQLFQSTMYELIHCFKFHLN